MDDERDAELIDYLRVLWRQKWVIAATFVAAVVAAWGASKAIAPSYEIETSLLLLPPLSSDLGAESASSRLAPEAYEQLAVSTILLGAVLEEVVFPETVTIETLKKRFSVDVKRLSSGGEFLLTASIRDTDPQRLFGMAEAWTDAFEDTYGELFQDSTTRSFSYVSENYDATDEDLTALIGERNAFLSENPIEVLKAEALALQSVLTEYSAMLLRTRQALGTIEAYLAARPGGSAPEVSAYVLTSDLDPNTLMGALAFGLSAEEYREIVTIQLQDLEQSIGDIQGQLANKQQQIDVAEATLSELDRRIGLLESSHAMLARKLQEAKIALAETPEPIRLIDEPLVPRRPIAPRKTVNVAIAGFLGLMLGTLFAFLVDYLARVREQEVTSGTLDSAAGSPASHDARHDEPDQETEAGAEEDRQKTPS